MKIDRVTIPCDLYDEIREANMYLYQWHRSVENGQETNLVYYNTGRAWVVYDTHAHKMYPQAYHVVAHDKNNEPGIEAVIRDIRASEKERTT